MPKVVIFFKNAKLHDQIVSISFLDNIIDIFFFLRRGHYASYRILDGQNINFMNLSNEAFNIILDTPFDS